MKTVYKYLIPIGDDVQHTLFNPVFLHVGLNPSGDGMPCAWFQIDKDGEAVKVDFTIVGTGHPVPEGFQPLGTIVTPPFAWHVLQRGLPPSLPAGTS